MDNVSMGDADLVFEIGLGFEHWMDKMYLASGSKAKRIILSRGIVNNPLSTPHEHHDHHAYGHRHEDIDPHVWHNVRYVIGMVSRIRESLSNKDPVHALEYARNAEAYISELEELDRWILLSMAQIPKSKRKLVTNHDSLSYYCERYQLELIGVLIDSFTTEAQDPSARDMAELIFKIKKEGVPAVFAERSSNSKTLQALAQEAGITAAPSLYTDALGPPGSEADTYIKFMRFNTETIVKNLL
jgi:ABC-type Zn uptake system ZnuABC Zn-binding protein ZnuA